MRQLLQEVASDPVYVSTPRELETAILQGRHHIIVTAHLDMTSMPLRPTTICLDGCESPLPEIRETKSIRGECLSPPDEIQTAIFAQTPGAARLLPFYDKQCLILTHEDLLQTLSYRIWLDNLYLRAVYHNAPNTREYQFISLSGFAPLKWPLTGQGKRFITRTTFQGDGLGPAVGVWADENMYIENCTFANLGGNGSDSAVCSDCTGNVNAAAAPVRIVNSTFFDPMRGNLTNYIRAWGGGNVLLTGCTFATPPDIKHPLFYARDNSTIYADDTSIRVRNDTGAPVAASPAADAPVFPANSNKGFLQRNDSWFVSVMDSQNQTVDPQPSYPAPPAPVPRLDLVEGVVLGGAADAGSGEPADLSARAPPAANDDDGLPPSAIIAIIVPIVLLLLICLAALFLLLRRRRRQRAVAAKEAAAAGGGGMAGRMDSNVAAFSSLPWDKASIRSEGAVSGVPSTIAPQPSRVTSVTSGPRGSMHGSLLPVGSEDTNRSASAVMSPVPPAGAPVGTLIAFIQSQLDTLGPDDVLLNQYKLLGSSDRRTGSHSVVAFAAGAYDRLPYAIKLFATRKAFDAEAALRQRDGIRKLAPRIHAMFDPDTAEGATAGSTDRFGRPLPPCMVIARGESLSEWTRRAHPDVFQAVAVLAHVATRLRDIHAAGYVHCDVKPEHILLLPRENRWTLADFDRAAAIGASVPPAGTLDYAPPEVLAAASSGGHTIQAHPALDAWALGVVAFELLTGKKALDAGRDGFHKVAAQLRGEEPLPWEGNRLCEETRHQLGIFCQAVLGLLRRDPAQRARMEDFCDTCNDVVMSNTTMGGQ